MARGWHRRALAPAIARRVIDVDPVVNLVGRRTSAGSRFTAHNIKLVIGKDCFAHAAATDRQRVKVRTGVLARLPCVIGGIIDLECVKAVCDNIPIAAARAAPAEDIELRPIGRRCCMVAALRHRRDSLPTVIGWVVDSALRARAAAHNPARHIDLAIDQGRGA